MRSYEEVAERVFRRGNEIIKRNKRRRNVMIGVCSSAACLVAALAVSFGEWAHSRRGFNSISDIYLNWTPGGAAEPGSAAQDMNGQSASDAPENSVTDVTDDPGDVTENSANVGAADGELELSNPISGVIVEKTDMDGGYKGHKGIDIRAPMGAPVYAAADGQVVDADGSGCYNDGRGSYIVIQHDNGYVTNYYHLGAVSVTSGQRVTAGDTIGEIGSTGETTGGYLHFELRYGIDGTPLNPLDFLPEQEEYPDEMIADPEESEPFHVTTVIDSYDIGGTACYTPPENGSVILSEPLKEAMEHYGDIDEYGEDIIYYLEVKFFKDGEPVDPGDPIIREYEWGRLDGLTREFMEYSEYNGAVKRNYALLRLTGKQIEDFVPSDVLGYILRLVNEDGNGPVEINRDVIHLPDQLVDDEIGIASETGG